MGRDLKKYLFIPRTGVALLLAMGLSCFGGEAIAKPKKVPKEWQEANALIEAKLKEIEEKRKAEAVAQCEKAESQCTPPAPLSVPAPVEESESFQSKVEMHLLDPSIHCRLRPTSSQIENFKAVLDHFDRHPEELDPYRNPVPKSIRPVADFFSKVQIIPGEAWEKDSKSERSTTDQLLKRDWIIQVDVFKVFGVNP